MRTPKPFLLALLLASVVVAPGCSLMASSTQTVSIHATDPRADIFVDGAHVGRGAATATVKRDEGHTIMARVGDRIGYANIGTSISGTGILDIIGGCLFLVPFIGIAGAGFRELDQTSVSIVIPDYGY